jgi:hypothetical protein
MACKVETLLPQQETWARENKKERDPAIYDWRE